MCGERQVKRLRGVSLVEVLIFVVLVGVAAAAVLGIFASTSRRSADPLIEKQALAIAESLLEEIRLMPFSFCDPDDANAATAVAAAACATTPEAMGPEPGENRYAPATPFDNVNDYNGFTMPGPGCAVGICDLTGAPIPFLAGYSVAVTITAQALGAVPAADALLIRIDVAGPGGIVPVRLDGMRTRHAPNV